MSLLGHTYSYLNQFEKAEAVSDEGLTLRRNILGEEHLLTINSLCIQARTYVQQGKFAEAKPLTERVLDLGQRLPLENGLFTLWNVTGLGWSYLEQGHVDEAVTLCELAVQASRRKPDGNPLANANTIIDLGAVRLAQERYADAEKLLREGLPFVERYWAGEAYRPYVLSLLGASLSGQKKYADANRSCCRAMKASFSARPACPRISTPRAGSRNPSNGWCNSTTPGANPPKPPNGNRNWPRSSKPPTKAAEKKGAQP